jgi:hypothetical protein
MAAGDVVVTCFRLQQAATAGEIVVGEVTYRATQRMIDYAPIDPVAAKGRIVTLVTRECKRGRS